MAYKLKKFSGRVAYLKTPGRENIGEVVNEIKLLFRRRKELRSLKIVVFTAHGEGAITAFTKLVNFNPKIIAVTFPRTFSVMRGEQSVTPTVSPQTRIFFEKAGIKLLTPQSLPFDSIAGLEAHNQCMRQTREVMGIFGPGFTMCVQAVLRACDEGLVEAGEFVVAFSADTAAVIRASPTTCFLTSNGNGLEIAEIICRPQSSGFPATEGEFVLEGKVSS